MEFANNYYKISALLYVSLYLVSYICKWYYWFEFFYRRYDDMFRKWQYQQQKRDATLPANYKLFYLVHVNTKY